ncbi:hypothetical protein BBJ29_006207 [Phytophthora kernoviae]|uniref:Uncharacterized protein n=1 Tax=Phytophthora kernoviae TaxID=325452 RepID=A0A421FQG8_9STRA|nr:hypothetical protein BBJ29_006207 [Phytophthora kernoviae]
MSGSSPLDMTTMVDKLATPATATSTITSTRRNWVGPWSLSPDAACYREAHFMDTCPSNFDRNDLTNTCWTECPLGYPVECGMECIQQNNDCKREVLAKTSAVAMSTLSMATFGVFGELTKLGKTVTRAVKCTNSLLSVLRGIILFTRIQMTEDPQTPQAKLLTMLYQTNNVVTDLPIAIYACLGKDTFGIIINDLIRSGKTSNGTSMDEKNTAYKWIDNGLITIAVTGLDPTDLSTLFAEYLQTICGPTQFLGEIDDGTEDATLGLNALKDAFKGSTSSWAKKGDGVVIINFTSKDTEDVTVNIMSGGDKIDKVKVFAGGTASWSSNITTLGGKTLYLDRWRPGFLGLPGTGGGSLVLWVPIARHGGHLEVNVQLNVS